MQYRAPDQKPCQEDWRPGFLFASSLPSNHLAYIHIVVNLGFMRRFCSARTRMLTASTLNSVKAVGRAAVFTRRTTSHPAGINFRSVLFFAGGEFMRRRILPTPWIMDGSCGRSSRTFGFHFDGFVVSVRVAVHVNPALAFAE
jgi:hypothetical protein